MEKGNRGKIVGWYHRLKGHKFALTSGEVKIGNPGVVQSWGRKELDMTVTENDNEGLELRKPPQGGLEVKRW